MFARQALRRIRIFALPALTSALSTRAYSASFPLAAGSSPSTFVLDRSIFNQALYSRIREFWFAGLPANHSAQTDELTSRWYGGGTDEETTAFDHQCSSSFQYALAAISPSHLTLPPFEDPSTDLLHAPNISHPFLTEVTSAASTSSKSGADTLLALLLLLDQLARNIYRDPAGLRLVYTHYDRLAFTLLHSAIQLSPESVEHPDYRLRPVIASWYLMPLMHSEHLPSHEMYLARSGKMKERVEQAGDRAAVEMVERSLLHEEMHLEPLRRFGRYPHRNRALGRSETEEETRWLEGGGGTFGVRQGGEKDEL